MQTCPLEGRDGSKPITKLFERTECVRLAVSADGAQHPADQPDGDRAW